MISYRIILTDDHEMFRQGLKSLIERDPGLKVVGEAQDGERLLEKLKSTRCDLVILDLSMPNMDGIVTIKRLKEKFPKIKILVLTMQKDQEHFKQAMSQGVQGFVLKEDAFDQLIMGIKVIMRDKQFVSPSIATLVTDRYIRSMDDVEGPSLEILTKREKQILGFIANGSANKNIAAKLKISIRTVEAHRANLSNKLGIKNTAGLVKFAIAKGMV